MSFENIVYGNNFKNFVVYKVLDKCKILCFIICLKYIFKYIV